MILDNVYTPQATVLFGFCPPFFHIQSTNAREHVNGIPAIILFSNSQVSPPAATSGSSNFATHLGW
uniref:Uncharacterized protein n=1 Tax=Arundo donax TaxID=35708 RepID=A0A0A9CM88_ARUDO